MRSIGIIASELPPTWGGMQEHARGLITNLAAQHRVHVFTSPGRQVDLPNVLVSNAMTWRPAEDARILEEAPVDAWITLNAGLASHGRHLSKPTFSFAYANDFLVPWQPAAPLTVRALGKARRLLQLADPQRTVRTWRITNIRKGLHAAVGVFAISHFARDLCCTTYGLPPASVTVIPPGINDAFLQPHDHISSDTLRLVTVSRLDRANQRKNVDGVLQALALLGSEIEFHYTIIGSGDDKERLEALASSLGLAPKTSFLGAVARSDILRTFAASDLFIMVVKPSTIDHEGFGMVYAEAAASGLPSIATALGGIPDAVQDGVTGVLLDDASPPTIATAIRSFHHERSRYDPARIRSFAEGLSSKACTAAVLQVIADRLRDVPSSCLRR